MKNSAILLALFLLVAGFSVAQEKGTVTIEKGISSNGAVAMNAVVNGQKKQLQCNEGSSDCKLLKAGDYVIMILPPNHGMYDCKNVDIYANGADPSKDDKLGEYCLNER